MSNLQNDKWIDIKKDYLDTLAWEIYNKGCQYIEEDVRTLMLDKEDQEYLYEAWARINAEIIEGGGVNQ